MKNLLKSVMVVLALMFVCVKAVNADPACVPPNPGGCFNGSVTILLRLTESNGTVVRVGPVVQQPEPDPDVTGQARVTQRNPPVGRGDETGSTPFLELELGVIGGQAGPGFGAVFITSTGQSPTMVLTNNGTQAQTLTFIATGTPDLHTRVAGFGTAGMTYVFSVVTLNEMGGIIGEIGQITLISISGNNDFNAESTIERHPVVPAGGTVRIAIRGTITGNAAVPEPTTILLLGTGLAGVAMKMRKKLKLPKSG